MNRTVKDLYVNGDMTARTHTEIHKALNSMHDFKAYDDAEWTTMKELLENKNIKGALRRKIINLATM